MKFIVAPITSMEVNFCVWPDMESWLPKHSNLNIIMNKITFTKYK